MSSNILVQRICQYCNTEFTAKTTVTKYCSNSCAKKAYKVRKRKEKIEQSNQQTKTVKNKPIIDINSKEFLTVPETAILLGCSTKTVYRLIERNEIHGSNLGTRMTRIKRSEIDKRLSSTNEIKPQRYDVSECYTITQIVDKYGISNGALYNIIQRNEIPRQVKGKFTYVPKSLIDNILT